jgi:hypothetical protein
MNAKFSSALFANSNFSKLLKIVLDRIVAAIALIIFSPLILMIAITVYLRICNPVIFTHPRLGTDGRPFPLYKFRSMTNDCDADGNLLPEEKGLPRAVMESICMETPVIGADIRGTRDLLADGCGLLVKVGDIEALGDAIAWVLDHPQEARMIGKRGRERITNYDLRHVIKLHEALYVEATFTESLVTESLFVS